MDPENVGVSVLEAFEGLLSSWVYNFIYATLTFFVKSIYSSFNFTCCSTRASICLSNSAEVPATMPSELRRVTILLSYVDTTFTLFCNSCCYFLRWIFWSLSRSTLSGSLMPKSFFTSVARDFSYGSSNLSTFSKFLTQRVSIFLIYSISEKMKKSNLFGIKMRAKKWCNPSKLLERWIQNTV